MIIAFSLSISFHSFLLTYHFLLIPLGGLSSFLLINFIYFLSFNHLNLSYSLNSSWLSILSPLGQLRQFLFTFTFKYSFSFNWVLLCLLFLCYFLSIFSSFYASLSLLVLPCFSSWHTTHLSLQLAFPINPRSPARPVHLPLLSHIDVR